MWFLFWLYFIKNYFSSFYLCHPPHTHPNFLLVCLQIFFLLFIPSFLDEMEELLSYQRASLLHIFWILSLHAILESLFIIYYLSLLYFGFFFSIGPVSPIFKYYVVLSCYKHASLTLHLSTPTGLFFSFLFLVKSSLVSLSLRSLYISFSTYNLSLYVIC